MRGIIRSIIKTKHFDYYLIIALSLFLLTVYISFSLPNADAVTRAEYDDLKDRINQFGDKSQVLEELITEQRVIINEDKNDYEILKKEWKILKDNRNKTWDEITEMTKAENEYLAAVNIHTESRDRLFEILREKSDLIKENKVLKKELLVTDIDKPKSLSHLTKRIGVSLSKLCETMLQNNYTTACPTYKQLVQIDTSNTDISGKFTTDDNGFFHREPEKVQNSYRFYWNDEQIRIFVDPPGSMAERIKMIYIQPNFDIYTLTEDMTVQNEFELVISNKTETLGNMTRITHFDNRTQTSYFGTVQYHDRYIDKCKEATINADNWEFLLPDTIHLMRNDCDRGFTAFEEREVILPEYSEIDVTTSPNWIFQQAQKYIEEFCIFKYKQC